jgi:DNA-binding transcriptional LysR family regulator
VAQPASQGAPASVRKSKPGRELAQVLPGWNSKPEIYHFIYPAHRAMATRLRVFLDFISQELRTAFSS